MFMEHFWACGHGWGRQHGPCKIVVVGLQYIEGWNNNTYSNSIIRLIFLLQKKICSHHITSALPGTPPYFWGFIAVLCCCPFSVFSQDSGITRLWWYGGQRDTENESNPMASRGRSLVGVWGKAIRSNIYIHSMKLTNAFSKQYRTLIK